MEIITGVFENQDRAANAINRVRDLGLTERQIGYVTPERKSETSVRVPVADTEDSGMGKAMGAAVGAGMGAAGGATLGLAAALLVPGVGPVVAFGLLGAALLGGTGAAVGATIGDQLEEELGEGIPHEDIYLYEDALRRGHSVVVVYAEEGSQADSVRDILTSAGALNVDDIRENWWAELRDKELLSYQESGRDFGRDELSYRRGFATAQHTKYRGKALTEVENDLRERYSDVEFDEAFRTGYERGVNHHLASVRNRKE